MNHELGALEAGEMARLERACSGNGIWRCLLEQAQASMRRWCHADAHDHLAVLAKILRTAGEEEGAALASRLSTGQEARMVNDMDRLRELQSSSSARRSGIHAIKIPYVSTPKTG
jgi:hypothetical protein